MELLRLSVDSLLQPSASGQSLDWQITRGLFLRLLRSQLGNRYWTPPEYAVDTFESSESYQMYGEHCVSNLPAPLLQADNWSPLAG